MKKDMLNTFAEIRRITHQSAMKIIIRKINKKFKIIWKESKSIRTLIKQRKINLGQEKFKTWVSDKVHKTFEKDLQVRVILFIARATKALTNQKILECSPKMISMEELHTKIKDTKKLTKKHD